MAIHNRMRFLQGAAALLYLGPLLAGLGGYGWRVVPVFAAIFVLWLIILRPQHWPRDLGAWRAASVWAAALGAALMQVLLVAVCFGIGRGLGGIMGFLPLLHPMLPIGLSFLAIPLCRLIWDPWKAEEMDRFLDQAIQQISRPTPSDFSAADAAVSSLLALPGTAPADEVAAQLAQVLDHPQSWARLDMLVVALDRLNPNRDALRRAVILWGTGAGVVTSGRPPGTVDSAFQVAGHDPAMLRLFLPRALALIADHPTRHDSFPSPRDLAEVMDDRLPGDINDSLARLSQAVHRATPPELRDLSNDEAAELVPANLSN